MEDENVISSPQKLSRSIHRLRLDRKNKRFNSTVTKSKELLCAKETENLNKNEYSEQDLSGTLLVMYDSEEGSAKKKIKVESPHCNSEKSTYIIDSNFDPFAEQRLLVLADRFAAPPPLNITSFETNKGFQPCHNFLVQPPELLLQKCKTSTTEKMDTFEITDSELLQVCEQNERNITFMDCQRKDLDCEKSPSTPKTIQKPKSIVELILEDFCSSPVSPELQQSSEESNFQFKFSNEPLRTYSRRKYDNLAARKNIAKQYLLPVNKAPPRRPIDDDLISNGSSTDLSVQEDHTPLQNVGATEQIKDLHLSQNLCENLQNLSAYFAELSDEKSEKVIASNHDANLGLSLMLENASILEKSSSLKTEILEINNNLQISADSYISFEEELKGFESEEDDTCDDGKTEGNKFCDRAVTPDNQSNLDTDDEWNDECDLLTNFDIDMVLDTAYKVEKKDICKENRKSPHTLQTNEINDKGMAFRTAPEETLSTSAKIKTAATNIWEVLPLPESNRHKFEERKEIKTDLNQTKTIVELEQIEIPEKNDNIKDMSDTNYPTTTPKDLQKNKQEGSGRLATRQNMRRKCDDTSFNSKAIPIELTLGFRTASFKAINISKEAQERAAKILQQLPELTVEEELDTTKPIALNACLNTNVCDSVGFQTASRKNIQISKEAQGRAQEELDTTKTAASHTLSKTNMSDNAGFQTASRKNIQISEEAQKRASLILQEEMNKTQKSVSHTWRKPNMSDNVGFQTASGKNIEISEEAQKRASLILQEELDTTKTAASHTWRKTNMSDNAGFQATSDKNIEIPEEAQKRASLILQEELDTNKTAASHTWRKTNMSDNAGFQTASGKNIQISEEAQKRASLILQEELDTNKTAASHTWRKTNMCDNAGFQTASDKNIEISEEAQKRASLIFQEEMDKTQKSASHTRPKTNMCDSVGFQSASRKNIQISEEAQKGASLNLQKVLDTTETAASHTWRRTNMCDSVGYQTASRKNIQTSKEAQRRAALILQNLTDLSRNSNNIKEEKCYEIMQFSEWPVDEELEIDAKGVNECKKYNIEPNFPGFSTASKKTIVISDAAKQKAAALLDNFNALSVDLPQTLENAVFSEWPILEANEDSDANLAYNISNQRKGHNNEDATENCEEHSSPQSTLKSIGKSPNTPTGSPLAHIEPSVKRSSLSELAVKTPPDYRASRGVISRKNLLSLSKRNKLNAKTTHQNVEECKDESLTSQTPIKKNVTSTNSIVPQSPPDTPTINLQEFFRSASVSTSTPQPQSLRRKQQSSPQLPTQMHTRARRQAELETVRMDSPTNDVSMKRIEWDNDSLNKSSNKSDIVLNASKLSNSSFGNIMKMDQNPTPKQRIARLRMYGKPPNVSPIHMYSTDNCRTSGLKRLKRSSINKNL